MSTIYDPPTLAPMVDHVLKCLESHTRSSSPTPRSRPLFVAVQGPQGSGKTFLTNKLKAILCDAPHNLSIAVLSIDDLYLPHAGLKEVASSHPDNVLLSGRGQPGTHDVPLGSRILRELKKINDTKGGDDGIERQIEFPVFEKSLFGGEGDRLSGANVGTVVKPPVDVVLFEGWCVGFCPVLDDIIDQRYEEPISDIRDFLDIKVFKKEHIKQINENLWAYVEWWSYFDCFIRIAPPDTHPLSFIYKWRLQQEHNMKAKNGGRGMSDDEVKRFVDRYIPGYVFFSDGIERGLVDKSGVQRSPTWRSNGLKVVIDENRELLDVHVF